VKYKTFRAILMGSGALAVIGATALFGRACFTEKPTAPRAEVPTERKRPPPPKAPRPPKSPEREPSPTAEPIAEQESPPDMGMERPPVEPLRPFDREILESAHRSFPGDKLKDAMPGRPFKINLYKEPDEQFATRLKVDLDRDDKWDEKWSFSMKNGQQVVKRQVAPNDDENYTIEYRLRGEAWMQKGGAPTVE
jgi:hypothetical protein